LGKKLTIKEALKKASLTLSHLENPQKEARLLLSFFLQKDFIYLTLHDNEKVDKNFFKLVQKRAENIPLEYITNSVSFYSEEFFIDYGALIPRPESELLIDEVLKLRLASDFRLAEIGVGSGILSIMLSKLTGCKVVASDISLDAIKVAKENVKRFGLEDSIKLIHTSYLDGIEGQFDIIISNPPYIEDGFNVEKNLSYEPQNALYGGKVGNEIVKDIVDLAIIKKPYYLVCEMGYDQKESMTSYFKDRGVKKFWFYKDLSNFDRGFVVEFDRV